MPSIFETITAEDARQELGSIQIKGSKEASNFYIGDHWQGGDGWIGPRPATSDTNRSTVLDEIERGFVSKNAVREVVHRHRNGVVGHEPGWNLVPRRALEEGQEPSTEEQALIDEGEAALVEWWDGRRMLGVLQEAVATLLWGGRSVLRLFVPRAKTITGVDGAVTVPAGDLQESLGRIFINVPELESAGIITDPDSQEQAGVFFYKQTDLGSKEEEERVELHFLNEEGQTVIRSFSVSSSDALTEERATLDLGGNLLLFEMQREPLITKQVRQNQALLNMALTMLGRNVVLAGFLERVLLNAQLPGTYEDDPKNTGKKIFVPDPLYTGAGTFNNFVGVPLYGDQNDPGRITGYANPSIIHRDPVPVTTFEDTKRIAYESILQEADQIHILISGDATSSGESRRQAMAQFLLSLLLTKAQVDAMGRWLIETTLAMAATFAGQVGRFAELRASFDSRIDPGPIPSEEMRLIIELVKAQLLSRETGMTRLQVEDPDAEMAKIEEEDRKLNIERAKLQMEAAKNGTPGIGQVSGQEGRQGQEGLVQ